MWLRIPRTICSDIFRATTATILLLCAAVAAATVINLWKTSFIWSLSTLNLVRRGRILLLRRPDFFLYSFQLWAEAYLEQLSSRLCTEVMRSTAKRNPYYKTIVCPLMRHSKWIKCMRCDDSIDDDDDDSTDTKRLAGWICRSIENMYRSKERQKGGWFSSVRNHYCRKSMRKVSLSLAR